MISFYFKAALSPSLNTKTDSTTKQITTPPNTLTKSQCYFGSALFLGGLNLSQAQAEAKIGSITQKGANVYWYSSNLMSGGRCASSCLKYGFVYAAIESK